MSRKKFSIVSCGRDQKHKMKKNLIQNIGASVMLICFILSIVLLIIYVNNEKDSMKKKCQENCKKYNLPFLRSETSSYIGHTCFCLDTDGKPIQIPSR